jgi:hypothetical protein
MHTAQIRRATAKLALALSLFALFLVLTGYLQPPHHPESDEGIAAHLFQISIVLLAPTILAFLVTADWTRPLRAARDLAIPAAAVVAAFAALYYLEHFYLAPR